MTRPGSNTRTDWFAAYATVFVSSFCVMVVELVAGRIISRHLGSSIYTWTSVIGIILAGLALGNWIGGRIADRHPARPALSWLFLLSSATCVAINVFDNLVGESALLWDLTWPVRVSVHVALVFFVPATLMGTIGPIVGKLALSFGRTAGRTLGSIYALGVVGSIAGTFLTGYVLISVMGTAAIIWSVSLVLAATGLAYSSRAVRSWAWTGVVLLGFFLSTSSAGWAIDLGETLALRIPRNESLIYLDESRYSNIEIRRLSRDPEIHGMYLDKLLHSQITVDAPNELHYGYTRIFAALTRHHTPFDQPLRALIIGGGGYVFPRYLEQHWSAARVEVVEIDPAVTRAARVAFGFAETSKIRVHHADGRVFVNQAHRRLEDSGDFEPYDFIYLDAVNDFSVPFQITTKEFFSKTERLLAEDGLLLMNFIDVVDSGRLVGALARTLGEVFDHVALFSSDDIERYEGAWRVTLVLAAGNQPIDWVPEPGDRGVRRVGEPRLAAYTALPEAIVLTDSFAPIENLVAPVVRASSKDFAAVDALRRALKLEKRGDLTGYLTYCREALRLDPHLPEAHYNLGLALYRQGRIDEAESRWIRATSIDPDYAEAHYNLGALYYSRGELGAALKRFERAVVIHPTMAMAHNALGIAAEANGDVESARRHYSETLRLSPQLVETQRHLARLERGRVARASIR